MSNLFQKALSESHAAHRLIKKSDLGATKYDAWTGLSTAVLSNAYAVYADAHDNAGRSVKVVDDETAKTHRDALYASLRSVSETVGEVKFADENAAVLFVDSDFADSVIAACTQRGAIVNDIVEALDLRIVDAKEEVKAAKAHFDRYNYNGVSEDAKTEAAGKLDAAELALETLRAERKTEVAKKNAMTYAIVPNDEKKFRLILETLLYDMVNNQSSMSYEDYKAERAAKNKAKREARKAAKDAAAKKYGNK